MLRFCVAIRALLSLGASPPAFAQNAAAFQWIKQVDSSGFNSVAGFGIDAAGNAYIAGTTSSSNFPVLNSLVPYSKPDNGALLGDVYVTKLDPSGNVIFSTLFGGSGNDIASAMTVDASGNVYVTGSTTSVDFPVTWGAYATSGGTFVFKLNADGSLGYSTYFAPANTTPIPNIPAAIAVDSSGAAYLAGTSTGGLPTTARAYEPTCCTTIPTGFIPTPVLTPCGFLSKLNPTGSTLVYSTYVNNLITCLTVGADGTAYQGGANGILRLNAAGSALLATAAPSSFVPNALALAADGTLYAAGHASTFPTTPGAFETSLTVAPSLPGQQAGSLPYAPGPAPAVVARWDAQLANVLDATFFGGGRSYSGAYSIAFDSSGNVYLAGATDAQGLLTSTPLQLAFAVDTGFLSELSGDLSALLFSSYFGDTQDFNVSGIGVRNDGSVVLGGHAWRNNGNTADNPNTGGSGNPWVNSLTLAPAPTLRVNSVVNAASLLDGAISAGETIVVQGVGFGSNPQLSIGGISVPAISSTSSSITATVPQDVTGAVEVEVSSGGRVSNLLTVEVTPTSPGIFSQNGSGFGQGYILNNDGTLNSPGNPAAPGAAITVIATGVGPIAYVQDYAVSQYPVDVYIDQISCNGIEAFMGPVTGFPGNVYQIQVFVPTSAQLTYFNAPEKRYPPLLQLTILVNGVASQSGIAFPVSQ